MPAILFLPILAALCWPSVPALAAEPSSPSSPQENKASASSDRNSTSATTFISKGSADGLLTTTEQMIEKLILQIDRDNGSEEDENPSRTASASQPGKSFSTARSPFSTPSIRPVSGPITSDFGMRIHPIRKRSIFHTGIDFGVPSGTPIVATADGKVSFSGFHGGYGKKITISHANGYETVYAHLSKALVRQDQRVKRGDVIALSGNTGLSTGPHLHYEVRRNNMKLNPVAFFDDGGVPSRITSKESPDLTDVDNS